MRRRNKSPKGSGGTTETNVSPRGGRGRGRARGGAASKGKPGGRGSCNGGNVRTSESRAPSSTESANIIISKDILGNSTTSSHFSRHLNGSMGNGLQLGGIPRRPVNSSSGTTTSANNNNNCAVNFNNGGPPQHPPGSDYYLHKKFKKVTATVDATTAPSEPVAGSSSTNSSAVATSTSTRVVYKPKFWIKSDLGATTEDDSNHSSVANTSAEKSEEVVNLSLKPTDTIPMVHLSNDKESVQVVTSTISMASNSVLSSTVVNASPKMTMRRELPSTASSKSQEPSRISRDMRLDRKSLDDRISKIIDENQSILEWPEQFTKMLKNHTSRGSSNHAPPNPQQRTNHLFSGGSTVEVPVSSSAYHLSNHPAGILRHHSSSSSSDGMTTSGGSVELINSGAPSPLYHQSSSSSLNSNGSVVITIGRPSPAPSTPAALPTDLSFGAHHQLVHNGNSSGGVITTAIAMPSPTASPKLTAPVVSMTTTTSSKKRKLSPTPSRLCGGEVSELPMHESAGGTNRGGKGYFPEMDMTVRVSNCGTSGAKVTIRTNNGTISGGSVVAPTTPAEFNKVVEPSKPLINSKCITGNDSVFFAGSGPSSPLALVCNTNKKIARDSSMSPGIKSSRGRPPRKKSVSEALNAIPQDPSIQPASSSMECIVKPVPSDGKQTIIPSPNPAFHESRKVGALNTILPDKSTQISQSVKSENSNPVRALPSVTHPVVKEEPLNNDTPLTVVPATGPQNPKRPTFLALKPVNTNSKKTEPGVLPSPETPRVAKPYNQMTINGQAYTYLGFKVSTRSSYTCLFKTQPMFIPQETDPKLSMYTNWQPRPRDPNHIDIGISTNDSRVNGRKSPHHILYTSAIGKGLDTLTVSSPDNQLPISSPVCENKTLLGEIQQGLVEDLSQGATDHSPPQVISIRKDPDMASVSSERSSLTETGPSTSAICALPNRPTAVISSSEQCSKPIMSTFSSVAHKDSKDPGSDTSSGEESTGGFRARSRGSSESRYLSRVPDPDDGGDISNISSDSPLALTTEKNRVKIMEGGFESNEDYTYVRGRGRGRYVCEACGIRCKKPSMLRKHLKTHTDLRPYTCKLCNFSFKTKGNLTKHQKSKSHHKKCAGLGIHPESSRSLAVTGPGAFSISDNNTTDDNESDEDMDDDNGDDMDEGTDSQDEMDADDDVSVSAGEQDFQYVAKRDRVQGTAEEKEIAQSLLNLSKVLTLPHRTVSHGSASVASICDNESGSDGKHDMIEDISNSSNGSCGGAEPLMGAAMDLTVKSVSPQGSGQNHKRLKLEKVTTPVTLQESRKWEPPEDEDTLMGTSKDNSSGSKSFDLTRFLNNAASLTRGAEDDASNPPRILKSSEVKAEVVDYSDSVAPVPSNHQRPTVSVTAPVHCPPHKRPRTDSETSSCSSLGGNASRSAVRTSEPHIPQNLLPSSSTNAAVKLGRLHQPWLSPNETEENKTEQIEITPVVEQVTVTVVSPQTAKISPPIEVKPVNISPVSGPVTSLIALKNGPNQFKAGVSDDGPSTNSNTVEISIKEIVSGEGNPALGHPPHIQTSESPNAKLFSGLASLKPQAEFRQPSGPQALVKDEGKAECNVCGKTFSRASQLTLHMNIHYIERPFRCDPCGVSFRTKGHLVKHRRSSSHDCKVYLTEAWGVANEENPRPFKCADCKIAFRIHGHLAKHLRSKMHIMRMECLGKLPFGIFFEMEKSGINMNEIDTTDCDMSLVSLQNVARKIYGDQWRDRLTVPVEEPPT